MILKILINCNFHYWSIRNVDKITEDYSSTRSPKIIMAFSVNVMVNRITWKNVNCHLHNGRIIEYIVIISNNSITYNLTSIERYIIVNDLVFGNVYNMSVAGVNSIGRGPFSDPVEVQIGTSKYIVSYDR